MRTAALVLLFVSLALGAAPLEVATGLALVVGLGWGRRSELPMLGPVIAMVAVSLLASTDRAGAVEALGRGWALAPALAVPMLTGGRGDQRVARAGLWAAVVAGAWAASQAISAGAWPWVQPVSGPFSHHLTLGYALLVPLAWAITRRAWGPGLLIALGVLLAGSSGPLLSALVLVLALLWRPLPALGVGLALALALMVGLVGTTELHARAVLWASGAQLAQGPLGVGPVGFKAAAAAAQQTIEPGFFYVNHAHDSALQAGALAGLGAWVAWAWLLVLLWQRTGRAGRAALVALLVGGLTQDVLGDMEVLRALLAWALLPEPSPSGGVATSPPP